MANMKEDIGDLGAIGIFREAYQIFRSYAKVFHLILLTLIIDVVTLGTVAQYYFLFGPDGTPRRGPAHKLHSKMTAPFTGPSPIINIVTSMLFSTVFSLVYNAALSLALSATLHSVALHYAGQAVSFRDVIRASVPRLWMRLAITSSCSLLIANVIALLQSVGVILLTQSGVSPVWMMVLPMVVAVSSLVLMIGINMIFTVAQGVSVFEEDYGWAAASKGLKLLKGKVKVALCLHLLLFLPAIIPTGLMFAFYYEVTQADFGEWTFLIRAVTAAAYIVGISFATQFLTLCYGVQYASFKAYHRSASITDSIRAEKVGYERIGNGADEPLLGGGEKDSKV